MRLGPSYAVTLIRSLLGIALASALGATAAIADEVKLTFATLAPPDSRVAQMAFHPWADRLSAAGKGLVQLETRDGFAIANLDNVYSRVMDDVVQVGEDPVASMTFLDDGELVADMAATLAQMRAMPTIRGDRIATVGHCLGGRTSFLGLVHHPGFAAAALLYHGNIFERRGGSAPAPFDLAGNIRCPVLGLFGKDDVNPSPDHVMRLDGELSRLSVRHEFNSYADTGHAFQDFHNGKVYRQPAADNRQRQVQRVPLYRAVRRKHVPR